MSRRCVLLWKVEEFFNKTKGQSIESPPFDIGLGTTAMTKCKLIVYPAGIVSSEQQSRSGNAERFIMNEEVQGNISCFLHMPNHKIKQAVSTRFFIFTGDLESEISERQHKITETGMRNFGNVWLFKRETPLQNSGKFILGCEVIIHDQCTFLLKQNGFCGLWKMHQDKMFTDGEIKVGGEIIKCLKAVLAAQSTFFKSAFGNPTMLKSEHQVNIDNYTFECMKVLVDFCYKGELFADDFVKTSAFELLSAARYFGMPSLLRECEMVILTNLDEKNVFEVLDVAWKQKNDVLLRGCTEIIFRDRKIVCNEDYKALVRKDIELSLTIDDLFAEIDGKNPIVLCNEDFKE